MIYSYSWLVTLALALLVILYFRSSQSRLETADIEFLSKLLDEAKALVHVSPEKDHLYMDALQSTWVANMNTVGPTIAVSIIDDQIAMISGSVPDKAGWVKIILDHLEEKNFIWIPSSDDQLHLNIKGDPFVFRLDGINETRIILVGLPQISKEKKVLFSNMFEKVYELIKTNRTQSVLALQMEGLAEEERKKYIQALQVIDIMDHNVIGHIKFLLGTLNMIEEDQLTIDGSLTEEGETKLVNSVFPAAEHARNSLTDITDSVIGIVEGEVGGTEVFDMSETFDDMLGTWLNAQKETLKNRGVNLNWQIPLGLMIDAPKKIFFQNVWNIIRNSFKYTQKGEIKIDGYLGKDGLVYLRIADTGMGIKEDDIESIGNYKFRGEATKFIKGEGVGLWGVFRFMDLIGGAVHFKSEEGVGTTFMLGFKKGID